MQQESHCPLPHDSVAVCCRVQLPTAPRQCGSEKQEVPCLLPQGNEAACSRRPTAHSTALGQCYNEMQEFHCPLPQGSEAVCKAPAGPRGTKVRALQELQRHRQAERQGVPRAAMDRDRWTKGRTQPPRRCHTERARAHTPARFAIPVRRQLGHCLLVTAPLAHTHAHTHTHTHNTHTHTHTHTMHTHTQHTHTHTHNTHTHTHTHTHTCTHAQGRDGMQTTVPQRRFSPRGRVWCKDPDLRLAQLPPAQMIAPVMHTCHADPCWCPLTPPAPLHAHPLTPFAHGLC